MDARALDAARRMAEHWATELSGWVDPSASYRFALRTLVESGEIPAQPPENDYGWQVIVHGAAKHEDAFFDAWSEAREKIPEASVVEYDAPELAQGWPQRAVELVLQFNDRDFSKAASSLLPGLYRHDDLCARLLARLDLETPAWQALRTLTHALFEARDNGVRCQALETAWARLSEKITGGNSQYKTWLEARICELASLDLEAALALWEEHSGTRGSLDSKCHNAVLGRLAAIDPLRAWQLIEDADYESLSAGLGGMAGETPLPAPAVERLGPHLDELDCVSDWEEWLDAMSTAVLDGQIELVRRQLKRIQGEEEAADQVSPTARELAWAIRHRRSQDPASGDALFELLLPLANDRDRDEFVFYALR